MARSPFDISTCPPGHGIVHLSMLPPATPTFSTLTYAYPLKLLPSTPHILTIPFSAPPAKVTAPAIPAPLPIEYRKAANTNQHSSSPVPASPPIQPTRVPLLFLLSYGGGLLPPDALSLTLQLAPSTRLTLTTQGSTRIFPSPTPLATASQTLLSTLFPHSALLLAPDPTQPFRGSRYVQKQIFEVAEGASVGVLDWVSEGRRARGERWEQKEWRGLMEVWKRREGKEGERRLVVRDNVLLQDSPEGVLAGTMDGMGLFGTVILYGPLFSMLGEFFVQEFEVLPRIGGRDWGNKVVTDRGEDDAKGKREQWRIERWTMEKEDGVLWTAARVRGCVVIKFGAREVEGGRRWLGSMWREEGTVGREFGEGGLMCVR